MCLKGVAVPRCAVIRTKQCCTDQGPLGCHPFLDHAPGLDAVVDFFEVDGVLRQGAPQAFDERCRPIHDGG